MLTIDMTITWIGNGPTLSTNCPTILKPTTMTQVFSQQASTPKKLCHNLGLLSRARVVKLVDAGDSKSPAARRAGSIPAPGTNGFSANR